MKKLNDLEVLRLNKPQAALYKTKCFFCAIPGWLLSLVLGLWAFIKKCAFAVRDEVVDIATTFAKGNWAVKLSFIIFGFGNLFYGQIMRGILFLVFEIVFIVFMIVAGAHWLGNVHWFQTGSTVGSIQSSIVDEIIDYGGMQIVVQTRTDGDDSVKVLVYGLLTVIFIIAFVVTWRMQVKQCRICMDITAQGKKIKSGKDDLKSLLDDQFHKTLLTPSLLGILVFTVFPIIYMVLIAFTNYDQKYDGYANLFSWVGLDNFNQLVNFGKGGFGLVFGELLSWTLMWSFFATFSNYFLGMFVAIMINKKGIKFKKFWRTILVMTIAIPQFVSLLYVSKLFAKDGIIGTLLLDWNFIPEAMTSQYQFDLWANPITARVLIILINIWIGIPYIMLMATGILMNIPADLYESARIDGASGYQQFTRITLPYMLFVTGPYLLTSFVGNLNNFNVIYLLSGGSPMTDPNLRYPGAPAGDTDLLITWLYKLTLDNGGAKYYLASVVGILIFLVCAILSLIVYNVIPSTKNEEDFG